MEELISSDEKDEYNKSVQWSNLPSPPLEKIYCYLSPEDQVNMSLVCTKWREVYGSPAVWKKFKFFLGESQLSMDTCLLVKLALKYSSMFQHVEIEYSFTATKHLIDIWCRHFIEFLHILTTNSNHISVKFRGLWKLFQGPFQHVDSLTYNEICKGIAVFLKSQHRLKRVEFHQCFFGYQEGIKILRKLTEGNRESLTHLVLHRLVRPHSEKPDSNVAQILSLLLRLSRLTTLEIDYSFIVGYMFASGSDTAKFIKIWQRRVIPNIILHYDNEIIEMERFRTLASIDWRLLKELYPDQKVECHFKINSPTRQEVEFLIALNMPITQLNYTYAYDFKLHDGGDFDMSIDGLLSHLFDCKINDHLTSLCLKWSYPMQVSTLIPFLLACSELKCLQLFLVYPADGVILLMDSWIENLPESLKKVYINVSRIENNDHYFLLMKFTTGYVQRLELMGLNVNVDLYDNCIHF